MKLVFNVQGSLVRRSDRLIQRIAIFQPFIGGKCSAERKFVTQKNFEVENFQLLTMIFSENFLEWKWAFKLYYL
jgi:hypothetical protein